MGLEKGPPTSPPGAGDKHRRPQHPRGGPGKPAKFRFEQTHPVLWRWAPEAPSLTPPRARGGHSSCKARDAFLCLGSRLGVYNYLSSEGGGGGGGRTR